LVPALTALRLEEKRAVGCKEKMTNRTQSFMGGWKRVGVNFLPGRGEKEKKVFGLFS
jgi:hypothetical protein